MTEKYDRIFLASIKTLMWTTIYSGGWVLLEFLIEGKITDRPVDNIIMLLFIPMIFVAMVNTSKKSVNKKKNTEEKYDEIFLASIKTLMWTLFYSTGWVLFEFLVEGKITDRPVDNIIMLLFIPMIFVAMLKTSKKA